jgi:hypothetical protein
MQVPGGDQSRAAVGAAVLAAIFVLSGVPTGCSIHWIFHVRPGYFCEKRAPEVEHANIRLVTRIG